MSAVEMKHPIEGEDSWIAHLSRNGLSADDVAAGDADQTTVTADTNIPSPTQRYLRRLSKAHKSNQDDDDEFDPVEMENLKYEEDLRLHRIEQKAATKQQKKSEKKRVKKFKELYQNSGVGRQTSHGLMVRLCMYAVPLV